MLDKIRRPGVAATGLALLVALTAAPGWADEEKKVRVKKIQAHEGVHRIQIECDGEDCDQAKRAIVIGDGGELHEVGEDFTWIGEGGHAVHRLHGGGAFLGVQLTELTNELRAHFGVPAGQGVMVAKVVDDSPAAKAGVQVGDVITAVDGETVENGAQLARRIRGHEDGATVALELWRDGKVEALSPTLETREMEIASLHGGPGPHHLRRIEVRCEEGEGEEDCEVSMGHGDLEDFDCGGADECAVRVECDEEGCECTANGDVVDCETLPGFDLHHGD